MRGWSETRLVFEREVRESFRRRSLWIIAGLLMLGTAAMVILPDVIDSGGDSDEIVVVEPTSEVGARFEQALHETARAFDMDVEVVPAADRSAAEQLVSDGDADVAVVPDVDPPVVIVSSDDHEQLVALARQTLVSAAVNQGLGDAGLSSEQISDIFTAPEPTVEVLDTEEGGRRAAAFVASIVVYILLLMLTSQVATGIAIEKSNRVAEVLLAIVRPGSLLFGKVLGVGAIGLFTLCAGALPVVVKMVVGGDLPAGVGATLLGSAAWFVIGIAIYLTLAGALGALVARQEEVGSAVAPLSVILIGAYIIGQSAPESPLGVVLAYIPFTSPMVMPSRIALDVASPLELAVSLGLGVVTMVLTARVAATIYRRAIVRTSRRLKVREVLTRPAR